MAGKSNPQAAVDLFESAEYNTRINKLIDEWHIPALSISLVHNGTTTSRAFGKPNLDSSAPCTPSTLFDIASCSKSLTAASVGLFVDDDENYPHVQWDTPISKLLPDDFVMSQDDCTRNITVEDILSHRTGLPTHDGSYLGQTASTPDTPKSVTRNLRNLELNAGLRAKYQYCNIMFTVAAHLVEVLSGMHFADFLQEKIFDSLGMKSTFLYPEVAQRSSQGHELAVGYEWFAEKEHHCTIPYDNTPEAAGAGCIVTTPTDYCKWLQAFISQSAPLSPKLVKGLTTPRTICNGDADAGDLEPHTSFQMYALAWETYFYRGLKIVRHDGCIGGFSSVHFFLPEHGLGGALFGNTEEASSVGEVVMKELIDELLQIPKDERPDWNAIRWKGYNEMAKKSAHEREDVLEKVCSDLKEPQPFEGSLEKYTGKFWNSGYRGVTVEAKEGKLFVDMSDRSCNGFWLKFEHLCDGTLFLVNLVRPFESANQEFWEARFVIENGLVVKMGLKLEPDIEGLIWFNRVLKA
ncbi:unnamed protein product [Zymoseptoria tritici ST99CH_1E4]|uniref:Beta-lactamase-related domain-containing protein n=1 Tax=Zymoseptoria tritici ST99CH_1E4 TaxID=1276532 RepID=A0A2H1G4X0_ZYMTR|nr:unnamed protein product [Zymoseptoria tritici ST99CH_1E4]